MRLELRLTRERDRRMLVGGFGIGRAGQAAQLGFGFATQHIVVGRHGGEQLGTIVQCRRHRARRGEQSLSLPFEQQALHLVEVEHAGKWNHQNCKPGERKLAAQPDAEPRHDLSYSFQR
jgi:hypothetical protein